MRTCKYHNNLCPYMHCIAVCIMDIRTSHGTYIYIHAYSNYV